MTRFRGVALFVAVAAALIVVALSATAPFMGP